MQAPDIDNSCPECSTRLLDTGDELVCPGCGIAKEKQVMEAPAATGLRVRDLVQNPLGSYMGPLSAHPEKKSTRGITGTDRSYDYLKVVSDYTGRDEGPEVACARLIERVGEMLCLPTAVVIEAASVASKVLARVQSGRRITVAAVSAYSMISACRVSGMTAVSPRELMGALAAVGKRVSSSSVIQLALESPIRTYALGPGEYLPRVLARLSMNQEISEKLSKEGARITEYFNALRETARELLELTDRTEVLGKRPCALAASAVYSAEKVLSMCEARNRRITQRELAMCGDTSEYTVRDQCAVIFMPAVQKLVARRMRTLILPSSH